MTESPDRGRTTSRRNVLRATAVGIGGTAVAGTSAAGRRSRDATNRVEIENGRARPVFADETVVRENAWVETPVDTDGTGSPDRVHVEIARPESAGPGNQLPVVIQASPYYGGLNYGSSHPMDEELYVPGAELHGRSRRGSGRGRGTRRGNELTEEDLLEFTGSGTDWIGPSEYEEEFLPRGFNWVYAASIGTEQSTGCPTIGGSREIAGIRAVIDWLNGRADAYDSVSGGSPVEATWTDGTTGMLGKSYNGTLPNGVAATGVDGLETIVPIAAISSWYTYYRANGAVIATGGGAGPAMDTDSLFDSVLTRSGAWRCSSMRDELVDGQERLTGNKNEFWDDRDYVLDVDNFDASVFVVHGLLDNNVKTRNASRLYEALTAGDDDTDHRMWLMQAGHDDPIEHHPGPWIDALNVWLTHWLQEPGDAIDDLPIATVERTSGGLDNYDAWPHQDTRNVPVRFTFQRDGPGGLRTFPSLGDPRTESFVDDPTIPTTSLVNEIQSPYSLVYRTEPLSSSLHVNGTIRPSLFLSCDKQAALVTAILVDYGPSGARIVNRGWMNATNFETLRETKALDPIDGRYRIQFPMQGVDHVFEPNHRLGIVLRSSDYDFTRRPSHNPELTLIPTWSGVELPVVGGLPAFRDAAE